MNRAPVALVLQMARDLRMFPVALLCMMASLLSLEVSVSDGPMKKGPLVVSGFKFQGNFA